MSIIVTNPYKSKCHGPIIIIITWQITYIYFLSTITNKQICT